MPTSGVNRWSRFGRWSLVGVCLLVVSAVEMLTGDACAQTPPPTVRQVQINAGAPQRSMVTAIAVDFSKDVSASLTPASLTLLNRTTGQTLNPTNSLVTYDPVANRATWTFPALTGRSLPDGDYLGTLSAAAIMDAMGNHLDGNGDGTPNDDYTFSFIRYFGDADGDRDVDFSDLFKFRLTYLLSAANSGFNPEFDFNGDGRVDAADLAAYLVNYLTQLPVPVPPVPPVAENVPVINTPANLALFNTNRIAISGLVGRSVTYVTVNGAVATLTNGMFTSNVLLREGNNLVTVVAVDDQGRVGSSSVQVALDVTPPRMAIDSPRDGSIVSEPQVIVAGVVNDTVVGTVNGDQATVTVNGLPATVANRTYVATRVPLVPGTNLITATGTDRAGNRSSTSISVTYNTNLAARIKVVSGDGQSGRIGDVLPQPLVVRAVDAGGAPCPNKRVIFKVIQNDGLVLNSTNAARALVVTSDSQGLARVQFQLGTRAGAGNQQVSAKIVAFEGEAIFCASAQPSTPGLVVLDAGNNQVGIPGQALPSPFVAIVVDSGNNRLHNVPITYTVKAGGGSFGGRTNLTVNTDSDGRALAVLTLGPDPGDEHNIVEATYPGNIGLPVTFVASSRIPGNPAETSVSGVVLDNSDQPVPGATLRIVGHPIAARSDANGYFMIKPAPVGTIRLVADGATVTRPGAWVWLQFDLVTIAGQDNGIGRPVRLIAKDMAQAITVDETHGGTLTLRQVPGYSLKIAPNSVLFPDGTRSGQISVTVVHPDKMPDAPSFGQQPRFLVSIQPANALFNPPAPMSIPNLDGLPPGQKTDMYSYDHDMGRFVSIGTGTVSDDGTVISSDPGGGVIKAGWHCGGNPAAPGSTAKATVRITTAPPLVMCYQDTPKPTVQITAVGDPSPPGNPPYTWTSSDESIAKITAGRNAATVTVEGQKAGKARLTVVYRCKSNQPSAPQSIEVTFLKVEIQVNNTPAAKDDVVQVKCEHPVIRYTVPARARLTPPADTDLSVVLTNPDGRLRFPAVGDTQKALVLPKSGDWVPFQIAGESASAAIADAVIEAHKGSAAGELCGMQPATVFSFDQAKITLTPKGGYAVNDTATQRIVANTNPPSISYAASARLRPAGLDCTVDQIKNLQVSVAQNIDFVDSQVYDTPTITWNAGVTNGTMATVPTNITMTTTSGRINDTDAASDPLYDDGGLFPNIRQPPVGCPGAADATGSDTPMSVADLTLSLPAKTAGGVMVGTVKYQLNRLTSNNSFITWCVIYDSVTKDMCAIWEGTWAINMNSAGAAGVPTAGAATAAASTTPNIGHPFANDVANDPAKAVTTNSGAMILTK